MPLYFAWPKNMALPELFRGKGCNRCNQADIIARIPQGTPESYHHRRSHHSE